VKILLLITDLEIGGTPTVVRELSIRLNREAGAAAGRVTVACLSPKGPVGDQLQAAGVEVIAFNARGPRDLLSAIRQLVLLIRRGGYDTVFSFLIHANAVAAIASYLCLGVRFLQSIQTTQPTPRWHWYLQSLVHHAADRIVVPSPSAAAAAMEWAQVPKEKVVIIPNAVELDRAADMPPPSSHTIKGDRAQKGRLTIGFIGRLDPIKRVPDLVQAIALLDDRFTLGLFGDGEDRPRIEREIARLQLQNRVTLHGTIARPEAALAAIDVLVLPSAAEGFGLVLIEAMAAGVPVVATDVPGIRDVVRHGVTGLLVPVASPPKLAEAIRRVFEEPLLRGRLIEAARDEVQKRFSWDVVLPQYEESLNPHELASSATR
jgi:glycosyltransferase involved in cell wall biosynthesis